MNKFQDQLFDLVDSMRQSDKSYIFDNSLKSKLLRRSLLLKYYSKRQIQFSQLFWGAIPSTCSSKYFLGKWSDVNINPYLDIFVHHIAPEWFKHYVANPINILNYQWNYLLPTATDADRYALFYNLAELVYEIIVKDQYNAKEFFNLEDSKIILDCGANIGIFSLWAHYLSPKSRIYAFEPTQLTFKMLENNIKVNNLEYCISVYNEALGDADIFTKLRTTQNSLGTGNSIMDSESVTPGNILIQNIKMKTIDKFVQEYKLEKVDFIKIDTEGYEKQIIKGATETIRKFSPVVACSAYHCSNDKIEIPKLVQSINPNYQYELLNRAEKDLVFWVDK